MIFHLPQLFFFRLKAISIIVLLATCTPNDESNLPKAYAKQQTNSNFSTKLQDTNTRTSSVNTKKHLFKENKQYLLVLNNIMYDYPEYQQDSISLYLRNNNQWKFIQNFTIPQPLKNIHGIQVLDNDLLVVSHEKSDLYVYDLNDFFSQRAKTLNPKQIVPALYKPSSINVNKDLNMVSVSGYEDKGMVVLIKKEKGSYSTIWRQAIRDKDGNVVDTPSDAAFIGKKGLALAFSGHARIVLYDLHDGKLALNRVEKTKKFGLYYPIGPAYSEKDEELYIADHLYNTIFVFDPKKTGKSMFKRTFGGLESGLSMPYKLQVYDDILYTTNVLIPERGVTMHLRKQSGFVKPVEALRNTGDGKIRGPMGTVVFTKKPAKF